MIVLDTNIWIYSHDTRDPRKQAVAQKLIADVTPLALPWQVGCEFVAAARKLAAAGFSEANAWSSLADMQQMADFIALPDAADWAAAEALQSSDGLSFWDAVLLASCQRHEVRTIYSEDMGSPRIVQGIQLVNPFQ
jgi:predicted nucleic acid-binding protein